MTELPHRVGARTVTSLVADVLARVPELSDALVALIGEKRPSLPPRDLWRSCHDNLTSALQLVAREAGVHEDLDDDSAFDAARTTGRLRARQRMPLEDVLHSFRLGGRLLWEALVDRTRAGGDLAPDELLNLASWVWAAVDATSAQVAIAYHATERELLHAEEQRRAALWDGLLDGRAKHPAFALQAARSIGVPVEGPYAVVVLDDGGDRGEAALARDLADAGLRSAWQVRANTLVGLIATADTDPVLAVLRHRPTAPGGVSLPVPGLAEMDLAHRQAVLARNTVPPGLVEVAALAERLPEALLLNSPDLAEALVRRRIGPLLAVPPAERRLLLDTLTAWLATGGSVNQTANAVRCHRNTVINRLRRIGSITGLELADPATHLELTLALRASWLLPPA